MTAIGGIYNAVEKFRGMGFRLVPKDYTYDGYRGVDLVFRRQDGRYALHATVEAKGNGMMNSYTGGVNLKGDPIQATSEWTINRLQRAARTGNSDAGYMLERIRMGRVEFYTSFMDGTIKW